MFSPGGKPRLGLSALSYPLNWNILFPAILFSLFRISVENSQASSQILDRKAKKGVSVLKNVIRRLTISTPMPRVRP